MPNDDDDANEIESSAPATGTISLKGAGEKAFERLKGLDFKDAAPDDDDADEAPAPKAAAPTKTPADDEDGAQPATPDEADEKTTSPKTDDTPAATPEDTEDDGTSRMAEIDKEIARYETEAKAEREAYLAAERDASAHQRQETAPQPMPTPTEATLPPLPKLDLEMATPEERQQYEFLKSLRDREVAREREVAELRAWRQEQQLQANVTRLREQTEKAMGRYPEVFGDGVPYAKQLRKNVVNDLSASAEPVHLIVARVAREALLERKQAITKTVARAVARQESRTGGRGGSRADSPASKKSFAAKDLDNGRVRDRAWKRLQEVDFDVD